MTVAQLVAARDAALSVAGKHGIHIFDEFPHLQRDGQSARMPGIIGYALWTRIRNRIFRI